MTVFPHAAVGAPGGVNGATAGGWAASRGENMLAPTQQ